jgi:hypothetical protein
MRMSGPTDTDAGLRVQQIRVYFDPTSGEIVHVHQLLAPAGDPLDEQRIEDEMQAFEESVRDRHSEGLEYIVVDDELVREAVSPEVNLRVDVSRRKLVREES